MLEGIFGNRTAEKVLLHIYHYGEIHATGIASDYGVAVDPIKKQLERFERAGVLAAKTVGRARLYSFQMKSPYTRPVKDLVATLYNGLSLAEKEQIFRERRRPRSKGKPVL